MSQLTMLGVALTILLMIAVLYRLIERAFLREEDPEIDDADDKIHTIDRLAERRALILREIKDIEFDHEIGKINDEDYRSLRRRYQRQWLAADKRLEAESGLDASALADIDAEIERRLEALHSEAAPDRARRRICPRCAAANPLSADECAECGRSLAATTRSPSGATPGAKTATSVALLLAVASLALAGAPGVAHAQNPGPVPPGAAAPNDAIHGGAPGPQGGRVELRPADIEGQAEVRVQVLRQTDTRQEAPWEPAAGVDVDLQWRTRDGSGLAASWTATSDDAGWAVFEDVDVVRKALRLELRAVAMEGSFPHVSEPIVVNSGSVVAQLRMMPVTARSEAVIGGTMVTILSIPERMNEHPASYGFVRVQQIIEATTDRWAAYQPGAGRGVAIDAPIKASSLSAQVMGGAGTADVAESTVWFRGLVYPPDERFPTTRLMLVYFLEADGSTLDFEQPMSLPFADIRVTLLLESDLPDHPIFDGELDVPLFAEHDDEAADGVMEGRKVQVARGLSLARGDTLEFTVRGLPYPDDPIPWILIGIAVCIVAGGVFVGAAELRRSRARAAAQQAASPAAIAELDERIEAAYAGIEALELDRRDGIVTPSEYSAERSRLRMRIGLLTQKRERLLAARAAETSASA